MKKTVIATTIPLTTAAGPGQWLDLEQIANVEVTSEDPNAPIEAVFALDQFASNQESGWRAAGAGQQIIRVLFAEPRSIHRICLKFSETQVSRTQEFTLRWASSLNGDFQEIVRQQWNFSPEGSNTEMEDYTLNLAGVAVLELAITPDVSGGGAVATLAQWRLA